MINIVQPANPQLNYQSKSVIMTLLTGLTPNVDIGSITLPTIITNYIIKGIYIRSVSAAGTLGAGVIDFRTAANGGGSSILSGAATLTGLTASNLCQTVTPVLTSILTARNLFCFQSIGSANAGTILVTLDLIDLS